MSLFPSVPEAMNTLLLDGLLADYSPMIKSLGNQSPILWIIGLAYVLLVAITVLYMLVGHLDILGLYLLNFVGGTTFGMYKLLDILDMFRLY